MTNRQAYVGTAQRTFGQAVVHLLETSYRLLGSGRVLELIAHDVKDLAEQFYPLPERLQSGWMPGQMSLFALDESEGEDWGLEEKMTAQQELLGTSLEAHPLELLADQIARSGAITTAEAAERLGQRVTIAGIRQTSRRSRTARGETMLFLTIEDLSGMLDVIVFPDVYRRTKTIVSSNSPMLITGTVETDGERDEPYLKAEKAEFLA